MRVLHITACIGTASYGLGPIAVHLVREHCQADHDAEVWCTDDEDEIGSVAQSTGLSIAAIRRFGARGPACRGFSPSMRRAVRRSEGFCHVVHQHGIWTAASLVTRRLRDLRGARVIVAPHGALGQWAIGRSAWKKRVALTLYERDNLEGAACLHATSSNEVDDFRRFGLRNPIALVPNGVSREWLEATASGEAFRARHGLPRDAQVLLFLSRVTPKKGIPLLLNAVAKLRAEWADWLLVIAGPDEFGHEAEVRALAAELGISDLVRFIGPIYGAERLEAFAAASLFVLPTHSEGSPLVVLEALARGVPVVTTVAAGWADLANTHIGWSCDVSAKAIADALREAISLDEKELREYGRRARSLVTTHYTWRHSADQLLGVYHWMMGESPKPDWVQLG